MNTPDIDAAYAALHQEVDNYLHRLREQLHDRIETGREQHKGAWVTMPLSELETMLTEEEADVIVYRLMLGIRLETRKGEQ